MLQHPTVWFDWKQSNIRAKNCFSVFEIVKKKLGARGVRGLSPPRGVEGAEPLVG